MTLQELREICDKATDLIRPVPGMSGYYAAAFGNIWSINHRWGCALRKLSPHPDTHGYLKLKIKRGPGLIKTAVHKMLL